MVQPPLAARGPEPEPNKMGGLFTEQAWAHWAFHSWDPMGLHALDPLACFVVLGGVFGACGACEGRAGAPAEER